MSDEAIRVLLILEERPDLAELALALLIETSKAAGFQLEEYLDVSQP